jgi:hypothetical protein
MCVPTGFAPAVFTRSESALFVLELPASDDDGPPEDDVDPPASTFPEPEYGCDGVSPVPELEHATTTSAQPANEGTMRKSTRMSRHNGTLSLRLKAWLEPLMLWPCGVRDPSSPGASATMALQRKPCTR